MIASARRWRDSDWQLFEPKTFEAGRQRKLHGYLGAVSQVDAAVGMLLDYLRESGQAEDTIVVYTSDHGIMEKAPGICSDAITRVPLIWWAPSHINAGSAVDSVVELVDIANTLCSLAGIDLMETSDGRDISRLLAGESSGDDRIGVTEFAWSKSIRKGQFRLVHYPRAFFPDEYPGGIGELYDLAADPWEMQNLYFEADYQSVVEDLRSELLEWLITSSRPRTVSGVNSSRFETPKLNPQRRQRYQTVVNLDGKINPALLHSAKNKSFL